MTLGQFQDLTFYEGPLTYKLTILEQGMEEFEVIKAVVDEENKRVVLLKGNVVT